MFSNWRYKNKNIGQTTHSTMFFICGIGTTWVLGSVLGHDTNNCV